VVFQGGSTNQVAPKTEMEAVDHEIPRDIFRTAPDGDSGRMLIINTD